MTDQSIDIRIVQIFNLMSFIKVSNRNIDEGLLKEIEITQSIYVTKDYAIRGDSSQMLHTLTHHFEECPLVGLNLFQAALLISVSYRQLISSQVSFVAWPFQVFFEA